MNAIALRDVGVAYGAVRALDRVTLSIDAAVAVGVIGANGSGKSTLLKTIAGLLRPSHGEVTVRGVAPRRVPPATIAYVPQSEHVDWSFPANARDVVAMGRFSRLKFWQPFSTRDRAIVDASLERMGLRDFSARRISALSGGQQQRVFLARALAQEPAILLLDEPTTGVDAETEEALRATVRELVSAGTTVVMSTHDLDRTDAWFDRVVVVDRRIVADGTPEEIAALGLRMEREHAHGHAGPKG